MRATGALALVFVVGCVSSHQGDVMNEKIKGLDGRLTTQEQILEGRVKALDESIDKATKMLARNSADLGTQVDTFSQEMASYAGRLETLQRTLDAARTDVQSLKTQNADLQGRLESIERQLGIKPGVPGAPPVAPTVDKGVLFDGAVAKMQAGQVADARKELRVYVQAFPQDEKADDAQFFVAQTFQKEKNYENAIAEYQRLVDVYAKSDLVDDAFLQAGLAALDGKMCLEAGAYLGELIRRFPTSPLAKQAKTKLDYVKKNGKNTKVCK
jgi:TolA-binding protein